MLQFSPQHLRILSTVQGVRVRVLYAWPLELLLTVALLKMAHNLNRCPFLIPVLSKLKMHYIDLSI